MPKLTKFQSQCAQWIQEIRVEPGIPTAWLPISYVMGVVEVESGFDPSIKAEDFATTGSVGLMQVEAATVPDVVREFPHAGIALPQTDPKTSLLTGMLYLYMCKQYLLPAFGSPLAFNRVLSAWNSGPGNAIKGFLDNAYYYKWLPAEQGFSVLNTTLMV